MNQRERSGVGRWRRGDVCSHSVGCIATKLENLVKSWAQSGRTLMLATGKCMFLGITEIVSPLFVCIVSVQINYLFVCLMFGEGSMPETTDTL